MFEFAVPWMFFLLPLPILVRWLAPAYKARIQAVRAPFFDDIAELSGDTPARGAVVQRRNWFQSLLLPVVWLLLIAALAMPQWLEDPITRIESTRDMMLAVDLSGSMEARDFLDPGGNRIDRLEAVKLVLDDFIRRREGDRLGLIIFGTAAFLQVPFTQDHDTFRILLQETQVRMAGPQTMIGDAVGLGMKLFENSETDNRVLILLTDGNDTGSKVPPIRAAGIAAQNEVTIHTIAVGDPQTVGEEALDTETLKEMSGATGGRFFQAMDREELERIYEQLDELEPLEIETLSNRPRRQLFFYPVALVLILLLAYHLIMAVASRMRLRRGGHDG